MRGRKQQLVSIVYSSEATAGFGPEDVVEVLRASRRSNAEAQVTGMLLTERGRFLQALEGPEREVRALFARIAADPRHHDVQVLDDESIAERRFADWAMANGHIDDPAAQPLERHFQALVGARTTLPKPVPAMPPAPRRGRMRTADRPLTAGGRAGSAAIEVALLAAGAAAAFVLGGLTSLAQAVPAFATGLANSPSGWTIPTVVIVLACARRAWTAAVLGTVSFALLNLGYSAESTLRGYPDSFAGFWVVAGFVVGPVVGLATFFLARRRGIRCAAGAAVLAAIGFGDAAAGLLRGTGGTAYWIVVALLGLLCLVVGLHRCRGAAPRAFAVAGAVVLSLLYVGALAVLAG